ncbi:putative sugar ABC transporter, ATP-binding protein [Oceaniovalibus guishaninsula JLT2003]|uniref:Putative sugar ABC transporter, ATP-binding protein n=1 Tax=Oceaniovalibus guishaninsula JLT2003 TaxID=1231392 RepID=K2I2X2_9RHOB|nr:ABC transporter ATP-binding protein [Oceaniovalibus guishaninsula]EKE43210.1 putative sugar ABC transporter, ATP-binding protein [Oceaniovalibus guishaninsula JLT2003]
MPGDGLPGAVCRLRGIDKRFGDTHALRDVSLDLIPGEVLALVGENGAGKTTLMNVLFGLLRAEAGRLDHDAGTGFFADAADAIAHGFGMVHQHFMLFDDLTVLENVIVGAEGPGRLGRIELAARAGEVAAVMARFGFALPLDVRVRDLPVATRQQIEIVKLLYRQARVVILDEPTAVLTPQEAGALFAMLRGLADEGRAVVVITHKLPEVTAHADRVVVMRGGAVVADRAVADTSAAEIARLMVGHDIAPVAKRNHAGAGVRLALRDLHCAPRAGERPVGPVDLDLRPGEILGIAGVAGSGQGPLVETLVGLRPAASGQIAMDGIDITRADVAARRAAGLAYMAEDRMRAGLAVDASLAENAVAGREAQPPFARGPFRRLTAVAAFGRDLIARYDIRATGPAQRAADLSGGNKQKIVVARELAGQPRLIVAHNPCWGVDIGAIRFIQDRLLEAARSGAAVVFVSSELDELFALSDRLAVLHDGRMQALLDRADLDIARVGRAMAGAA